MEMQSKDNGKPCAYIAHINEQTQECQTLKEHSENTARLCRTFAIPIMKEFMYNLGLLHDIGKYQNSFQKRIQGMNIKVEHSICGALKAKELYSGPIGLMMEYCISGHHGGIPDGGSQNDTPDMTTLQGRLKRETEPFDKYQQELLISPINQQELIHFLKDDCECKAEKLIDKFAFLTRYCFSCLTDADSLDTEDFCNEMERTYLKADFAACLDILNIKLSSFKCRTKLQQTRELLQKQVFQKTNIDAEIYLMNMPTGSGKTLCSMKFALERAIIKHKKRIIYIIPYNSIIDQTSEVFENLFQGNLEILRHQSTFSFDNEKYSDEAYIKAAKSAAENWDAPFIITTVVQFFESIYANKRGKLRKLHNMADSILIFDEAHLMPLEYMQPCLQAISYITKYLNSEAIFLTATMPDFSKLMRQYALSDTKILDLITDTTDFAAFKKCTYQYLGEIEYESLLMKVTIAPSSLIIVNNRKTARKLYEESTGECYHLSTYMTSYDRKEVLKKIRMALKNQEKDFPEGTYVPEERRITIISTSLIEAGVDLDVHTVFRELTGLDSILQVGGRCNREGKRATADTYIFELMSEKKEPSPDERRSITKGLIKKYPDISCKESIDEYFQSLFFLKKRELEKNTMSRRTQNLASIPFKEYAEEFELIDSAQISLVVPRDEKSRAFVDAFEYTGLNTIRKLQEYTCSVYRWELEDLLKQHAAKQYQSGIYCLENPDYYDENIGILFEAQDYFL